MMTVNDETHFFLQIPILDGLEMTEIALKKSPAHQEASAGVLHHATQLPSLDAPTLSFDGVHYLKSVLTTKNLVHFRVVDFDFFLPFSPAS